MAGHLGKRVISTFEKVLGHEIENSTFLPVEGKQRVIRGKLSKRNIVVGGQFNRTAVCVLHNLVNLEM